MNLFTDVRKLYGQPTVKKVRDLENLSKKVSRHRNHLTFTHRCKDLGLTPVSLKLKRPIRTIKAQAIINRAQKDLLRERIRVTSNTISTLNSKIEIAEKDLETLSPDVLRAVSMRKNRKTNNAKLAKLTNSTDSKTKTKSNYPRRNLWI